MPADDAYVNSVTELLPIWAAEGRKELSDHRSVWDWIKYNIRAHAINFSKRKSKERNEKEKTLQEELSKAKEELEMTPSDLNAHHDIKLLGKIWKPSTKKKPKESLYERVHAGINTGKKHEVFSKSGEKKSRKETYFTITAEIHAGSLVNFYRQYADRHMNLKFIGRVSA